MVLCWIALPVFAFLGIFSLKYRKLTKDSLECLFKTVTFRPCESGLDERIKGKVTGSLLRFSPNGAKFFYRNYKVISFIVLILFVWSAYASGDAIYNYVKYGNCNGFDSDGFCILDVVDGNHQVVSCEDEANVQELDSGSADLYEPCPCES